MSDSPPPKLIKWPFFLADLILLSFAGLMIFRGPVSLAVWEAALAFAATLAGAWLCVLPFLRDYQVCSKLSEVRGLAETITRIQHLEQIQEGIATATSQWHEVQEHAKQTVAASKELSDLMRAELNDFRGFLEKARHGEREHLKLEVEKGRRSEGQWVHLTVHILDHAFALQKAASRSGHPTVVAQLNQFQFACRDAVRRVGLAPLTPAPGEAFNSEVHQVAEGGAQPAQGPIAELLAPGYTYQGQLLRRAVVRLETAGSPQSNDQRRTSLPAEDKPGTSDTEQPKGISG